MRLKALLLSMLFLAVAFPACKKSDSGTTTQPTSPAVNTATPVLSFTFTQTWTHTKTFTPVPSSTPTSSPTRTHTPTNTFSPTPTSTVTQTFTDTPYPLCTITPAVTARAESEYNNAQMNANNLGILSNTSCWVDGSVDASADPADYFMFTAGTTGYYRFYLDCRGAGSLVLRAYSTTAFLGESADPALPSFQFFAGEGSVFYPVVTAPSGSGNYSLKLASTAPVMPTPISTATPGTSTVTWDVEYNNTQGMPQSLGNLNPGGLWFRGSVDSSDINDYLEFTALSTAAYTFDLDGWDNGTASVNLTVYDKTNNVLMGDALGTSLKTYTLNATSGTVYTLRVYTTTVGGAYHIKCR